MQQSHREAGERRRSPHSIAEKFMESLGADRVEIVSSSQGEGDLPAVTVLPNNIEELSESLRIAGEESMRVLPSGAGTWFEMGNAPLNPNVFISTARMNRVLEYEPADLTTTVEAGCTLSSFNERALAHRQFIPLDPPGSDASTLGAIASTASYGPLRCGYGTPRDWIIGMRVVHTGGAITKAGGKVVKNVAGYDLCKLYTGSYGTLGIIGELSLKLRARPSGDSTILLVSTSFENLAKVVAAGVQSDLQPAAAEIFSSSAIKKDLDTDKPFVLALRFLAEPETIDSQLRLVTDLSRNQDISEMRLSADEGQLFWTDYLAAMQLPEWAYILRISVLPSQISQAITEIDKLAPGACYFSHAANGTIRVYAQSDWLSKLKTAQRPRRLSELRQSLQQHHGSLVVERVPSEIKSILDVWGEVGPTARLMREVKAKLDPMSLLNPGRFVAGI